MPSQTVAHLLQGAEAVSLIPFDKYLCSFTSNFNQAGYSCHYQLAAPIVWCCASRHQHIPWISDAGGLILQLCQNTAHPQQSDQPCMILRMHRDRHHCRGCCCAASNARGSQPHRHLDISQLPAPSVAWHAATWTTYAVQSDSAPTEVGAVN